MSVLFDVIDPGDFDRHVFVDIEDGSRDAADSFHCVAVVAIGPISDVAAVEENI